MTWQNCAGLDITPREATGALALVTAAVEPNHEIMGFTSGGWQGGKRRSVVRATGVATVRVSPSWTSARGVGSTT